MFLSRRLARLGYPTPSRRRDTRRVAEPGIAGRDVPRSGRIRARRCAAPCRPCA